MIKIEKNNQAFPSYKWLIKAVSTDKTRVPLNYVYCDPDGQLVAVDGRRIHVLTDSQGLEFEGGRSYKVIVNTVREIVFEVERPEEAGNFPTWRQAMPSPVKPKTGKFSVEYEKSNPGVLQAFFQINRVFPVCMNDFFFSDAIGIKTLIARKGDSLEWEFEGVDEMSPVMLTSETKNLKRQAVIMPIRIK